MEERFDMILNEVKDTDLTIEEVVSARNKGFLIGTLVGVGAGLLANQLYKKFKNRKSEEKPVEPEVVRVRSEEGD